MKKIIAFLLTMALIICAIPFAVFAADPVYAEDSLQAGYYVESKTDNIELVFAETAKTVKIDSLDVNYYEGSVKFSVTVSDVSPGKNYIVLVSRSDSGVPQSAQELYYINQKKASGSELSFDVYPKAASFAAVENEAEYTLLITSDENSAPVRKAVIGFAKAGTRPVKQPDPGETTVSIGGVPENVTYGDDPFTLTASAINSGTGTANYNWTSSDPDVLSVSGSGADATVTVKKAGAATIKVGYSDSSGTKSAECSKNIIVSPKELTLPDAKVLGRAYNGTTEAAISGGALDGIVPGDDVRLSKDIIGGEYESPYVGQNITVSALEGFKLSGNDKANYTLTQPTGLKGNINLADQKFVYVMKQSYTKPFNLNLKDIVSGDASSCPDLTEHLNLNFTIAGYKIGSSDFVTTSAVTGVSISGSTLTVADDASDNMQLWFSFASAAVDINGDSAYEYASASKQKAFCITIKDKEINNSEAGEFYDCFDGLLGNYSVPESVGYPT